MEDYNYALELEPSAPLLYENRGAAYYEFGKFIESVQDYTVAIDLDPANPENYYFRSQAKFELNNKFDGCLDLKKAVELGLAEAKKELKEKCK
ncbi:hypothetical protein MNBD_BACTEROID06-965 [hydrothermal vent metagenome]|uniref:Uncharacterized protein n=1 Tax=hydrothermal vent metagenome TaxID=652676 RepID=A0A3B0UAS2_9ZZZZ